MTSLNQNELDNYLNGLLGAETIDPERYQEHTIRISAIIAKQLIELNDNFIIASTPNE